MDPQYVATQGDIGDGISMKARMDIRRRPPVTTPQIA